MKKSAGLFEKRMSLTSAAPTKMVLFLSLLLVSNFVLGSSRSDNISKDIYNDFECEIYLAPSSIANAGFGLFTTRPIKKGEDIQSYSQAPNIIVTDFYEPAGNEESDWNHVDYIWEPSGFEAFQAYENSVSVMTFGSLCNYHPIFKNVSPESSEYDDTILDRYIDPGAGAISYHNGNIFKATMDIDAGDEIFADYGENWLNYRPGTFADHVPRGDDYSKAADVLSKINMGTLQYNDDHVATLVDVISVFEERAAALLPKTKSGFENLSSNLYETLNNRKGRNALKTSKKQITKIVAKNNLAERDVNWIKQNGICIEKIRPGKSTIEGAGRGAFAQVSIKTGEIVAPAPLLNIARKDSMLLYESSKSDAPIGHQLLLNYCFGHEDVDLILCPQTNSILINHCSGREAENHQCNNGKGPNAMVRWAKNWDPTTNEWLEKSLDEIRNLTKSNSRGLSLEIIATHDISPGDEVFIDYGVGWENAWFSHIENWSPPTNKTYSPIKLIDFEKDVRTQVEIESNPYPDNVELLCYGGRIVDYELSENERETKIVDGSEGFKGYLEEAENLLPCSIVEKDEDLKKLDVEILFEDVKFLVEQFPRRSIRLGMKKYSSDQFMKNTFRHFMEIPDAIVPKQWLTVKPQ